MDFDYSVKRVPSNTPDFARNQPHYMRPKEGVSPQLAALKNLVFLPHPNDIQVSKYEEFAPFHPRMERGWG
jgi:hypothetical protein